MAVRVGFGHLPPIDGTQVIDSTTRSVRAILRFHGSIVQKAVQGAQEEGVPCGALSQMIKTERMFGVKNSMNRRPVSPTRPPGQLPARGHTKKRTCQSGYLRSSRVTFVRTSSRKFSSAGMRSTITVESRGRLKT